jgi:phosphatidylinositol N-acetylglucosaminyltransferase subunit C
MIILIMMTTDRMQGAIALNAAVFGSVLLASRTSSSTVAFALLCLALEFFALFPIMRHHLRICSEEVHHMLSALMGIVSSALLLSISHAVGIVYIMMLVFVVFGTGFFLNSIQKYKKEIKGPWDLVIPTSRKIGLDGSMPPIRQHHRKTGRTRKQ